MKNIGSLILISWCSFFSGFLMRGAMELETGNNWRLPVAALFILMAAILMFEVYLELKK